MGRKLNLSHLTEEESEQILHVIQKDFELRQKEKQRLGLIEEDVYKEEEKARILSKQKEFNENCCIRCCRVFGFIFNRKQECKICGFFICKTCGKYQDTVQGFVCNKCLNEEDLKLQSCNWFYNTVSQRFRRFGSAKVVRSLYKCKNANTWKNSGFRFGGSDSEVDSGYDPSFFNSLPHSPVKTRPSLHNVFDIQRSHDDSATNNELPVPSHRTPVHDKPLARASSLETLLLPSSQNDIVDSKSPEFHLHSGKPIREKRDIYKEAFESAKRAEENKFKSKFDRLVSDLDTALAHLTPSGMAPAYSSTSYGDVMVTYRVRMKELILIFEQRLRLAYESFDIPHPDESTTQRVKQNVSRMVEDLLGETLDLTSDEAVSDLSSLSEESGQDQNSFEDQIAQVIVSKLLENHRKDQTQQSYNSPKSHLPHNLGNYDIRSPEDEVSTNSDILRDFEELRDFVRHTQSRQSPLSRDIEETLSPIQEDPIASVHVDKDQLVDDFHTRCSSIDRIHSSGPPLPDFSEFDSIDFTSNEIDPDLLSMNLAMIPEETEEELEDDANDEEEKPWMDNWVFKGALSAYDNCGRRRVGHDTDKPLYMMVPNPEDNYVPKVGNRDADELSDLSDTDVKSTDELSDDENTFYAKTSEELARISRKHSRSSSVQTDSDIELDGSSSSSYKRRIESILQTSSDSSKPHITDKVKLMENLIPAEKDDPKFVFPPESTTIAEGERLKLSCTVAGTSSIDVFWYYEDQEVMELEDSEDYEIRTEGDRHSITMFNLNKTQSGQYMCIALSELGKCTKYFTVTVTGNKQELKKPEFIKGIQDVEIKEGQSVKFRCKVKGYPQPRVVWYKDGKLLKASKSCRIEKFGNRDYILTIDHATLDDDAEYMVMAKNVAGETKSSAQVIVDSDDFDEVRPMKRDLSSPVHTSQMSASSITMTTPSQSSLQSDSGVAMVNHEPSLSEKVLTTRNSITETAEDMLDTAEEITHLNENLDAVDHDLDALESGFRLSADDEENNNINLGDTSPLEAIDDYRAREKAAKGVRLLTSSALNMLRTAEEIIRSERNNSEDFVTSTPRDSISTSTRQDFHNNNTSSNISNSSYLSGNLPQSPGSSPDHLDGFSRGNRSDNISNSSYLSGNLPQTSGSSPDHLDGFSRGNRSDNISNSSYLSGNLPQPSGSSPGQLDGFSTGNRSDNISNSSYLSGNLPQPSGSSPDHLDGFSTGNRSDNHSHLNINRDSVSQNNLTNCTVNSSDELNAGNKMAADSSESISVFSQLKLDLPSKEDSLLDTTGYHSLSNRSNSNLSNSDNLNANHSYSAHSNSDRLNSDNSYLDHSNSDRSNCNDSVEVYNFGPKVIDSVKYKRDFESKESKRSKWEVKLNHPQAEIVNRSQNTEDVEEQIYMTAGKVYSLEDRVRDLESKVEGDKLSREQMSDLQNKVAKVVAQVTQSENEVNSIEKAVIGLQESSSPSQNSPRADTSSQLSSRRQSFDSGISSIREKTEPVRLVGHTGEDEVPESRGEYDADSGIELPSVNRLRAMFSNRKEDDFGDGNFKRIHSITARSVSKEQLEQLRGSKHHVVSTSPLHLHHQGAAPVSPLASPTLRSSSSLQFNFNTTAKQPTQQTTSFQVHLRPQSRESKDKDSLHFSRSDSQSDSSTFKDLEPVKDPVLIFPENEDEKSMQPDSLSTHAMTVSPNLNSKSDRHTPNLKSKSDRHTNLNISHSSVPTPSPSPNVTATSSQQKSVKSPTNANISGEKNKPPKIRNGSISARAAFWEKRITEGSVNDCEIEGEFPDMSHEEDKS